MTRLKAIQNQCKYNPFHPPTPHTSQSNWMKILQAKLAMHSLDSGDGEAFEEKQFHFKID